MDGAAASGALGEMITTASIFSGGELVGVGARAAGFEHLWGIEHVDEIAQVARTNGFDVITADVRSGVPWWLQRPDHLHASPPCPSFSNAKNGAEETREDVELAQATVRFIEDLLPRWFTLENVSMYRFSESWGLILDALNRMGYWTNVQNHLNMADWGVPQTRKRMIVRSVRGGFLPPLPQPEPWRGWYQAIEDLIPSLPESEFAPWQLARMPEELLESFLIASTGNTNFKDAKPGKGCRYESEPAMTVTCHDGGALPRAWLVDSAGYPGDDGVRVPVMRQAHEPANTIVANFAKRPMRAFVVGSTPNATVRRDGEPAPTVVAGEKNAPIRAFIISGQSSDDGKRLTIRNVNEPAFVVSSSEIKRPVRAAVPGRIVKMTPRALARFQAIPDDYALPDSDTLAVRIIGNGVPPLFMQKLLKSLVA